MIAVAAVGVVVTVAAADDVVVVAFNVVGGVGSLVFLLL